jgi:hypothetical protein
MTTHSIKFALLHRDFKLREIESVVRSFERSDVWRAVCGKFQDRGSSDIAEIDDKYRIPYKYQLQSWILGYAIRRSDKHAI